MSKFCEVEFPNEDIHIRIRVLWHEHHPALVQISTCISHIMLYIVAHIRLQCWFSCLSIYWQIPMMRMMTLSPYSYWKYIYISLSGSAIACINTNLEPSSSHRLSSYFFLRKRWALNSTCHFEYTNVLRITLALLPFSFVFFLSFLFFYFSGMVSGEFDPNKMKNVSRLFAQASADCLNSSIAGCFSINIWENKINWIDFVRKYWWCASSSSSSSECGRLYNVAIPNWRRSILMLLCVCVRMCHRG